MRHARIAMRSSPVFFSPTSAFAKARTIASLGIAASALLVLLLALARGAAAGGGAGAAEVPLSWELGVTGVGEGEADGFGGDGDAVVRRVLQNGNGYISYGALRRDSVACSMRGASYYNCRPGAQGNPYSRGCSAITRCRG